MRILMTLIMSVLLVISPAEATDELLIKDAWINEAPPVLKSHAAYMSIHNRSGQTVTLVSARSDDYERIEFHTTRVQDGQAHMQKQESLSISPGDSLIFSPGESHLMLYNPARNLRTGDIVNITLTFDNEQTLVTALTVKKAYKNSHHHH